MMGHKFWEGLAKNIGFKIEQIGSPMVKKASAPVEMIPLPDRIVLSEAREAGFFKLASPMGWGLYRVEDIDGGLGSIWSIEKAADGSQFLVKQTDPMGEVMRIKTAASVKTAAELIREENTNRDGSGRSIRYYRCGCGSEVCCDQFTNTCEKCGADYNSSGQLLAPREQWGEETGETYSDIVNGHDPEAAQRHDVITRVAASLPGEKKLVNKLKKEPGVDNPFAVAWSAYSKNKASKKTASFPEWGIELENTVWKANDGNSYVFVEGVTEGGTVVGMTQGNLGMFELSETFEMPKEQFMKSFTQMNENATGGSRKKRDMSREPKRSLPAMEDIKLPGENEPGATSIIDTRKKKASSSCGSCSHGHDGDVCDDCGCRIFVKKASTVYCSRTDCNRVAHDTFNGKRYCPRHLPEKKHADSRDGDIWKGIMKDPNWAKNAPGSNAPDAVAKRLVEIRKELEYGSSDDARDWLHALSTETPGALGRKINLVWHAMEKDTERGIDEMVTLFREIGGNEHDWDMATDGEDHNADLQCPECAKIDPHMGEHGIGPKPPKIAAAGWEDQWKAFFDEWKKLPEDIRVKAERKCIDDRIAELPEGSDFGSSDKWHTIYGAFSHGHVPGNLLAEVQEWLEWNRVAISDSDVIIREAAEKCPTCSKPMKENTDGNSKYCQGHD